MSTKNLPLIFKAMFPLTFIMPSIEKPQRSLKFKEKFLWTVMTLLIYLICCQIPLYGIIRTKTSDPLSWFRRIVASNRGTLMELGITPIVTSSMMVQFLLSFKLIKIDYNDKGQKTAFLAIQRLFSILSILFQAFVLIRSGIYGTLTELGGGNVFLIFIQLSMAGIIVLLLDELLDGGYGLGSGISLFIATNFCENVFWKAFSPTTINTAKGMQFEGAFIELLHYLSSKKFNFEQFFSSLNRADLPNIRQISGTAAIILSVVYLQYLRYDIPLAKTGVKGLYGRYTVRLLSTSNLPIIMQSTMISSMLQLSKVLFELYKENPFVGLLGRWEYSEGYFMPISGFAYYIFPVHSFEALWKDPLHFVVYFSSVVLMCGVFSFLWLDLSGNSAEKIARNLDSQGVFVKGRSRSDMYLVIRRFVNAAAILGGVLVGVLNVAADLFGTPGSGTGILISANLVFGYYKLYKEHEGGKIQ